MKTWKNRAQKLLIIHIWIIWAAFLELPIRPKIDFPYWKLGWGTLCSFCIKPTTTCPISNMRWWAILFLILQVTCLGFVNYAFYKCTWGHHLLKFTDLCNLTKNILNLIFIVFLWPLLTRSYPKWNLMATFCM